MSQYTDSMPKATNPYVPSSGASPLGSRPLACVLCQHRKVKCDRNSPCSNCIKANVTCIPSTPAPPRKRRRPNQDLRERLARCEELLKHYSKEDAAAERDSPATPSLTAALDPSTENSTESPAPSETSDKQRTGRLVQQKGGERFMDHQAWTSFYDQLQAMKEIIDENDAEEATLPGYGCDMPESDGDFSLTAEFSQLNLEDISLEPVLAFRLWHTFLERVNPLTKIIHAPSLQTHVIQAATDMSSLPLKYQALLYSIYLMATVSLSEDESKQMLDMKRRDALAKFTAGTRKALIRVDFMRNYDMPILQALVLYVQSLQGRYDRHASWIMSGIIFRIAIKMGYHRDGEQLQLTPFETEMRRRLWWHIIMQDTRAAHISGLKSSIDYGPYDTKMPSNLNDADLFPGSTEPVNPREGPTEMAFSLVSHTFSRFMFVDHDSTRKLEAALFGEGLGHAEGKEALEAHRAVLRKLLDEVLVVEQRYVDASAGPAHKAALMFRPILMQKMESSMIPIQEQAEWGTEIFSGKDNLFKMLVTTLETSFETYELLKELGFLWFCKIHFELDVFKLLTMQLHQRPMGTLSDRGWANVEKTYHYHTELMDLSNQHIAAQAKVTLKAWQVREEAFAKSGKSIEKVPDIITTLRKLLPQSNGLRTSSGSSGSPTAPAAPTESLQDMDPILSEFVDLPWPDASWDMSQNWAADPMLNIDYNLNM